MLVRAAVLAGVGVLLWLCIREVDWDQLAVTLRDATLWPLFPAMAIALVMLWCSAIALRIMLAPRHQVSTARLFRYTVVAYAASVIAPARAGEIVRVWLLKQRDGVPIADSAAAIVAQKIIDGMAMLAFVAPIPWLLPGLPSWVDRTLVIGGADVLALFVACCVALARVDRPSGEAGAIDGRVQRSWLTRFIAGMHVLRSPRRVLLVGTALLGLWIADLAMVTLVLYAVGIDVPVAAGMLILATLNLSIMVPTPANFGSLEVGVFAATRLLGVADDRALAFALLYHLCLVVPTLAGGLVLELRLVLGRERLDG